MDVAMIQVYHNRTSNEYISLGDSSKEIRYQNPDSAIFSAKIKSVAIDSLNIMSAINYHNLFVDWTTPSNFDVYDGNSADIDEFYDSTIVEGNWTDAIDNNSYIQSYYYCIATSVGDSDIVDWTNNNLNTQFTKAGLNLNVGTTYYIGVRAINNAGLITNNFYSNGQTLTPTGISSIVNNKFEIFPNPANNYIQIKMTTNELNGKTIRVYNVVGELVKTVNINNNEIRINIADLENGVYHINIDNYSTKFIKL